MCFAYILFTYLVGVSRLERETFSMSTKRSNQLSYTPEKSKVRVGGIEPPTLDL